MPKEKNSVLFSTTEIISVEYEYIAQTAFQANEDRARVTTFYVVSVGSLVGALLSTTPETGKETLWAFSGLFFFLSIFGVLTLLQLIRLREAWFESVKAMNQIKDVIIENSKNISFEKAFRWRTSTLPIRYKPWSVAFLLALQVSLLGTTTFGAFIYYAGYALDHFSPLIAIIGGILFLIFQQLLYKSLLK